KLETGNRKLMWAMMVVAHPSASGRGNSNATHTARAAGPQALPAGATARHLTEVSVPARPCAPHSHPALQSRLHVLQRVRRSLGAGADIRSVSANRSAGRARDLPRHPERWRANAA